MGVRKIDQEYLEDVALNSEKTLDELIDVAENLHDAIQSRLNKNFEKFRLQSGENQWLGEEANGVWIAFTKFGLKEELRQVDIELEYEDVVTIGYAYLSEFQRSERTIAIPGTFARQLKEPFFLPVFIEYTDEWLAGEYHTLLRFQELIWRYEMSPAEALDYWATQRKAQDSTEWSGLRGVEPEAVRKNVRQAKEKIQDDVLGSTHERSNLRIVSTDEIPEDGVHDKEEDIFYILTDEALDDMDLEE